MNSGQPPAPHPLQKIQVNPSAWILRLTLQLKIKVNFSTEN